jgi:hypothetical protein
LARRLSSPLNDEGMADVLPPAAREQVSRRPGALRGKIRMAPDFDTMPADVLAAMEGEED